MTDHSTETAKETPRETAGGRLPGDLTKEELIERIIRVDHAGEFGAKRIYEGQLAILRGKPEAQPIERMYAQELEHLKAFETLMVERRVRPSALHPVWNAAGFALGAATALLGPKAAMACTVAVEEVIDAHYRAQSEKLGADEAPLRAKIDKFRADELEHRDAGLEHGAEQAPAYPLLTGAIKAGSRLAIWLAERI
ncbi:demethoxyubiquinone hydroxylase family protein [Dongia deserti]|uniref:demethoxyubiquinone hydroxylase family protein n=1 Tax=Dongia deserti TaxID=2268030 RepID=UPI000E65B83D|nr:demethoxyubiquinone hydroxylase family protein [Dongia deserti]